MALVFWFLRKTVAPITGLSPSSTAPETTLIPVACACAPAGAMAPLFKRMPSIPAANATKAALAIIVVRLIFTLLPLPLRTGLLPRRTHLLREPVPAVPHPRPHTQYHILRRQPRRLLPLRPVRCQGCFHIPGSLAWQPPFFPGFPIAKFRIVRLVRSPVQPRLVLGRTLPQVKSQASPPPPPFSAL